MSSFPGTPNSHELDDLTANLFGLGSATVNRALVAFGVAYLVVLGVAAREIRQPWSWFGLACGFVLFATVAVVIVRQRGNRLGVPLAVAVTATTVAGLAVSYLSLPLATYATLQTTPATSALTILLALVILHGRTVAAWAGAAAATALAMLTGVATGLDPVIAAGNTMFCYPVLVVATLFAVMVTPMPARMRELRRQALAEAAEGAAARAAAAERDLQLRRLDERARPVLRQIADGHEFTPAEAAEVRLVEARLRDSIRAPGWDCPEVADAVWRARSAGVNVRLLDDGALDDLADGGAMRRDVRTRLVEELTAVSEAGVMATVTARISPPGRDLVATIVVDAGDDRRRVEFNDERRGVGGDGSPVDATAGDREHGQPRPRNEIPRR